MTTNDVQQLESQDWSELRRVLEAEAEALNARLAELTGPVDSNLDQPDEPHTRAVLAENTRRSLAEVTQALRRIEEGRYGRCEECDKPIPRERLEALPHARYCVPCQSKKS